MEPVFTLPYSEYAAANLLAEHFKIKDGYSIYVPASRQEKGVDLLLVRRRGNEIACMSFQVKASRTYTPPPPKRETTKRFTYYTWFNTFRVPREADFFLLFGLYPADLNRTQKRIATWWESMVLLFSREEMRHFIKNVKTRKGKRDSKFSFGFDSPLKVVQTRGDENGIMHDYSEYILKRRWNIIKKALNN